MRRAAPRAPTWRYARLAGVAATALVALLFVLDPAVLEVVELKSYDLRLRSLASAPAGNVTIVAIDEKSLSRLGRWPWSRATLAELVNRLDAAGARVIAFDVFFPEHEASPAHAAPRGADDALARALARSRKAVLGMSFLLSAEDVRHLPAGQAEHTLALLEPNALGAAPATALPAPAGLLANIPALQRAARYTGHINIFPDRDGTLRAAPLVMAYRERLFASGDLQAARLFLDDAPARVELDALGVAALHLAEQRVATDVLGRALIRYYGPEQTVTHVSAADVMRGQFAPATVAGKIALIGPTAKGIGDIRVTPYGAAFPGVEIRATIIENLLRNDFVRRPGWLPAAELVLLLALGLLLARVLRRLSLRRSALLAAAVAASWLGIAWWLFAAHGLWLSLTYPLLLVLLLFMSSNIVQYVVTEAERRHIKSAFQYYVPAAVVEEIARDVDKLRLGGEKRELTVLFSDIRGFTTLSEALAPEDLVRLLNVYLTEMTDQVFRHQGSLDKYIGDAIMAVYGAPIARPDHAHLACRTALDMLATLRKARAQWQRDGMPTFDIGIGINTGPMIVGNMGSVNRFNYTVIGDAVNLASRIEHLNKDYGTHVLMSEFTYQQVHGAFDTLREVDCVQVRGREQPVRIYELIPPGEYPSLDWLEDFARAYALLRAGDVAAAATGFERLHSAVGDPVSAYHAQRCRLPRRRGDDRA